MNVPREVVRQALQVALQRERARRELRRGLGVGGMALLLLFIVPNSVPSPYRDLSISLGAPATMTLLYVLDRDCLRSRRGTLTMARLLIGALWGLGIGMAGWAVMR